MIRLIRPLRSGQITIPVAFREKLHISPNGLLQISLLHGELRIKPIDATKTVAGSPWVKELYEHFAPVRDEAKTRKYTEEEINIVIDEAVRAVRTKHD